MMILFNSCHYSSYTGEKKCFDYPVVINMFTSILLLHIKDQGCANPGKQVARATKFRTVARNICGSSM